MMKSKIKVLFVCIHNSARSQMAEAFLNELGGDKFEAKSAGIEPGTLNPYVVEVMKEIGIDISGNKVKDVFDFFKKGAMFSYAITVCDEASAERCPIFPGHTTRMHWSFPDPSVVQGSDEEKLQAIRKIRDDIKAKVESWIPSIS
jgi:arsenate reductase